MWRPCTAQTNRATFLAGSALGEHAPALSPGLRCPVLLATSGNVTGFPLSAQSTVNTFQLTKRGLWLPQHMSPSQLCSVGDEIASGCSSQMEPSPQACDSARLSAMMQLLRLNSRYTQLPPGTPCHPNTQRWVWLGICWAKPGLLPIIPSCVTEPSIRHLALLFLDLCSFSLPQSHGCHLPALVPIKYHLKLLQSFRPQYSGVS